MDTSTITILLIEDNPGDAELIEINLDAVQIEANLQLLHAATLAEGVACLESNAVDLLLLDLNLPDSQGIDTLKKLSSHTLPIIVLTGIADQALALQAIQRGAQDFLVKGEFDAGVLGRTINYALERHRLQYTHVERQLRERQTREFDSLLKLSDPPPSSVTAGMFGLGPIRQTVPGVFDQIVTRYKLVLDMALEQRTYRVNHPISDELRAIAEHLGFLKAGPRDVIDVHSTALRETVQNVPLLKEQAYLQEGRLLVLELMGYLVSAYRTLAVSNLYRRPDKNASRDSKD